MYSQFPLRVGQGTVSFVTTSLGPNDPQVGDRCVVGNESYIFVCNIGSSTLSQTKACVVSGVSGYSVTVSSTSSSDVLVGVAKHADIATGSYGWVVTQGFTQVTMAATSGSVAAGGLLELSADGTFAPRSNTTGNNNFVGKAMAAIASSATGTAYICANV
jgi:hypothetical protein